MATLIIPRSISCWSDGRSVQATTVLAPDFFSTSTSASFNGGNPMNRTRAPRARMSFQGVQELVRQARAPPVAIICIGVILIFSTRTFTPFWLLSVCWKAFSSASTDGFLLAPVPGPSPAPGLCFRSAWQSLPPLPPPGRYKDRGRLLRPPTQGEIDRNRCRGYHDDGDKYTCGSFVHITSCSTYTLQIRADVSPAPTAGSSRGRQADACPARGACLRAPGPHPARIIQAIAAQPLRTGGALARPGFCPERYCRPISLTLSARTCPSANPATHRFTCRGDRSLWVVVVPRLVRRHAPIKRLLIRHLDPVVRVAAPAVLAIRPASTNGSLLYRVLQRAQLGCPIG